MEYMVPASSGWPGGGWSAINDYRAGTVVEFGQRERGMGLSNCWIVPMLGLGLLSCPHAGAWAEEGKQEIDTQFIFGFTAGADVGELGEKEIEHETIGLLGKRGGTYLGLTDQLVAEFVPVKDFRFEIGLPFAYYDIQACQALTTFIAERSTA